ncbi:hypothetical protein ELUMI_v1c04910 [Williamsoniiplasma luminosum]|uniref:Uncharacterized protein n=1 Tax=Williamsoniiplasma luminosum TaxID=214888 RepID=A0A2K8NTN7_9MOLU|nr:hypothetical protein ELUMI_v1c04910 [Williamsoniiplasma luminosum]
MSLLLWGLKKFFDKMLDTIGIKNPWKNIGKKNKKEKE